MNDRYLYKAKRTNNGEWIIGNLIIFEGIVYIMEDENTCIRAYYDGGDCVDFDARAYKVDPSTICQYTGLTDKNGKLIWENDILGRSIYRDKVFGKVVWTNTGFTGFMLKVPSNSGANFYPMGCGMYDDDDDENERCNDETIGNVFDNPSLLEGGAE